MDAQAVFHRALQLHQQGDLAEAESLYRSILLKHPNQADALHLLGMLMHQRGNPAEAEGLLRRAITINPNQAVYQTNLGLIYSAIGRLDLAVAAHRRATEIDPNAAEAWNNLAVALCRSGDLQSGIDCFKRATLLRPDYQDAQNNLLRMTGHQPGTPAAFHWLGELFENARRSAAAEIFYRRATELNPNAAESFNNLGNIRAGAGDSENALAAYRAALAINPNLPQACNNMANVLQDLGRFEEAIAAFQRAIELQPESPEPLSNLGNLFRDGKQSDLAMNCYQQALAIAPDHFRTHNNLAVALCAQGQFTEAIAAFEHAIKIKPDFADAIGNLGTALEEVGQRERAMALYRQAAEMDPHAISPPWNIALLQLLNGDYENGWRGYELRWRQKKMSRAKRNFPQPMPANLSEVQGKTILLHAEQGFGDAIQFCRYAPLVAALGADVILECPQELVRSCSTVTWASGASGPRSDRASIETVEFPNQQSRTEGRCDVKVVARGATLPPFDLQCPLMSLPMLFGTTLSTVPATVPYLMAEATDIERWRNRFAQTPCLRYTQDPDRAGNHPALRSTSEPASGMAVRQLRIGLVWAGQSTHQKDRHRSLTLADFSALTEIEGIRIYSLQKGEAAIQAKSPPPGMQLTDWTDDLHDFADTAAFISQLDLVISVDTAVCHLAGAIGGPVWILLAYQPDWRWLLNRSDSPWYPTARLFRQVRPDDWSEPLAEICRALRENPVLLAFRRRI